MKKLGLGLIMILMTQCVNPDKTTQNVKKYFNNKITFDSNLQRCLILPGVGCGGCIAGGVSFFMQNDMFFSKEQNINLVVFTAIDSKKILSRNIDFKDLTQYNCIIDVDNNYLVQGNNAIYPLILYLSKGQITKAVYQTPNSSNVLNELKLDIHENN